MINRWALVGWYRQTDSCFRDRSRTPTTLLRRSAPVHAHTRVRARRLTDRVGCTTAHLYVTRPDPARVAYCEDSCGAGWSRRLTIPTKPADFVY